MLSTLAEVQLCFRGITASIIRAENDDWRSRIIWNMVHFFQPIQHIISQKTNLYACPDFNGSALRILNINTRSFIGPFHYPLCCQCSAVQSVTLVGRVKTRTVKHCLGLRSREFCVCCLWVVVSELSVLFLVILISLHWNVSHMNTYPG
jgi:hypothetical protein